MSIETLPGPERNLTLHVVRDPITVDERIKTQEAFKDQGAALFALWDMSRSELSHITPEGILVFFRRAA